MATDERPVDEHNLFAQAIRLARLAPRKGHPDGLSQVELAGLLETSQVSVSQWENGARGVSERQFQRIAAALGETPMAMMRRLVGGPRKKKTDPAK